MIKVAFDIGGVLGKFKTLQKLLRILQQSEEVEVFVMTDMPPERARKLLIDNGFEDICTSGHLICANYAMHGERCKAVECMRYEVDILIDDHLPYVCAEGNFIGLLTAPRTNMKYAMEGWK